MSVKQKEYELMGLFGKIVRHLWGEAAQCANHRDRMFYGDREYRLHTNPMED